MVVHSVFGPRTLFYAGRIWFQPEFGDMKVQRDLFDPAYRRHMVTEVIVGG
jgi:hypothetical protein